MPFKINKTKLFLIYLVLTVVFSFALPFVGCGHNNAVPVPLKTQDEAEITVTVKSYDIAENEDEGKKEDKKMLPLPIVQTMPYYYIAVLNGIQNSSDAADELDEKFSHLIEMVNAADSNNIKLTLMFCPVWAEMFYKNSSKLALLDQWQQEGHEISCYHSSIYSESWDGYTDFSYDEALKIRQEIADKKDELEYAGNMTDFINKLEMINSDIKSGFVESGEKDYSYELLNNINVKEKYIVSDPVIYYTYQGEQDYSDGSGQMDAPGPYYGLNKFILTVNVDGIARKYLSHLCLETKQNLDSAIKASESYNSSYVFGIAVLNDINFIKYYFSLLQYIQVLDPEGLNSRTLSQIMEDKILE